MACEICGSATECRPYDATVKVLESGKRVAAGTELTYRVHNVSGELCLSCLRDKQGGRTRFIRIVAGVFTLFGAAAVVRDINSSGWIVLILGLIGFFLSLRTVPVELAGPSTLHDIYLKRFENELIEQRQRQDERPGP
jgi:hypothetical protein